ncbi:MAG TPA: CoA-binding protein [Egibacteraceae bacterium]|nr:CoA-binding protein [Egibacteraceae bacterium]
MPSDDELRAIYDATRTIAVVGASADPAKPAHSIPRYLQNQGYRIIPVNPNSGEILGEPAYRTLAEVDVDVDVVDVFRPPEEVPGIAREAAAIGAKVLWTQTGIESEEAAEIARSAGMTVVMGVCMGQTHARLSLGPGPD